MKNPVLKIPTYIKESHPTCYALAVEGASMTPTIPNGSFVIIDPELPISKSKRDVVVVKIRGSELQLCRAIQVWDQFVVFHDNPRFPCRTLSSSMIELVGTVVWVVHEGKGFALNTNEKSALSGQEDNALITSAN